MKMYIFVCLGVLLSSCASESMVPIELRKYDMCVNQNNLPTCDGYCYQGNVCVKKFLGICINKEIRVIDKIEISLKDKALCEKLFNMNFILQVREKPL